MTPLPLSDREKKIVCAWLGGILGMVCLLIPGIHFWPTAPWQFTIPAGFVCFWLGALVGKVLAS